MRSRIFRSGLFAKSEDLANKLMMIFSRKAIQRALITEHSDIFRPWFTFPKH